MVLYYRERLERLEREREREKRIREEREKKELEKRRKREEEKYQLAQARMDGKGALLLSANFLVVHGLSWKQGMLKLIHLSVCLVCQSQKL